MTPFINLLVLGQSIIIKRIKMATLELVPSKTNQKTMSQIRLLFLTRPIN